MSHRRRHRGEIDLRPPDPCDEQSRREWERRLESIPDKHPESTDLSRIRTHDLLHLGQHLRAQVDAGNKIWEVRPEPSCAPL